LLYAFIGYKRILQKRVRRSRFFFVQSMLLAPPVPQLTRGALIKRFCGLIFFLFVLGLRRHSPQKPSVIGLVVGGVAAKNNLSGLFCCYLWVRLRLIGVA
jgi:hypothetical protein